MLSDELSPEILERFDKLYTIREQTKDQQIKNVIEYCIESMICIISFYKPNICWEIEDIEKAIENKQPPFILDKST